MGFKVGQLPEDVLRPRGDKRQRRTMGRWSMSGQIEPRTGDKIHWFAILLLGGKWNLTVDVVA